MSSFASSRPRRPPADRWGVWLSGLCAVHCLALPLALTVLPFAPIPHAVHEWLHPALALALVPITGLAMYSRGVGRRCLAVGLVVVWLGVAAHLLVGEAAGTFVTLLGSCLLIVGHRRNGCTASCG